MNLSILKNKRISIFGYGTTTKPLVDMLCAHGFSLSVFDDKISSCYKMRFDTSRAELVAYPKDENFPNSIEVTFIPSHLFTPSKSDIEITSPGIAPSHPLIQNAKHLTSEYDLIYSLLDVPTQGIWISGTNGKTTTTEMTTKILAPYGALCGGNIGTPLATLLQENAKIWILETSSFTLHYTKYATPSIYALLPLREDHISWHGGFDRYIDDKLSVLERMPSSSHAIIPQELANHKSVKSFKGDIVLYTDCVNLAKFCDIKVEDISFKEPFLLDALIALSIAKCGSYDTDLNTLNSFKIGKHRIEEFKDKDGYLYVDDSKGTNIDATIEALRRYKDKNIQIVLGGDDKGANLSPMFEFIKHTFDSQNIEIYAIGTNAQKIESICKELGLNVSKCDILKVAMDEIMQNIHTKDKDKNVVLLSPAASSLDQFSSYKQRGDEFKAMALRTKI